METDRRNFAVRFLLFVRCFRSNPAAAGIHCQQTSWQGGAVQ